MGETKKAHQALYRKYRSKSLDEIVGQEHITKTLQNAIKNKTISHAYLFTGPRGVGKTSIARILAHEINNVPYTSEQPHLDIIEIDAASNRRIDDIRELREKVHVAPVSSAYKVYIIDEVHMLTTESFNALLKTLEEPPEHVIFILATTEAHKLPATIISRTQRHSFKSVPLEQVAKHLKDIAKKEGITIDDAALDLLAEHGEGSFRDSISLLDQMSSATDNITADAIEAQLGLASHTALEDILTAIQTGDIRSLLSSLSSLIDGGSNPAGLAKQLTGLIRRDIPTKELHELDRLVTLLDNLLLVAGSAYPELKLETVLINAALLSQPPPQTPTALPATMPNASLHKETVPKESKEEVKEQLELEVTTPVKKSPKKVMSGSIEEQWSDILQAIKEKNNSLYTILRLAKPELDGDTLTLHFGFVFHQKRANETKYKKMVAAVIQELLGQSYEVTTNFDKSLAAQAPAPEIALEPPTIDPAQASLVSQVQDIMGGGEIVHA